MRRQTGILSLALLLALGACDGDGAGSTLPSNPRGTIVGTVVDSEDTAAIVDATVTTFPLALSATTDANGAFELRDLSPGVYLLHVAAEGFESPEPKVLTVIDGGEHGVDFSLVALVLFPSTCQECHLQESLLLASLVDDPPPDATNEGGSAGEG